MCVHACARARAHAGAESARGGVRVIGAWHMSCTHWSCRVFARPWACCRQWCVSTMFGRRDMKVVCIDNVWLARDEGCRLFDRRDMKVVCIDNV